MVILLNQTNSTCQLSKSDLTDASDTVYYSTGEDNTFGTYMTSFLLAITLLVLTIALSRVYVPDFHAQYFLFYIISLGILSVSVFVAGFFYAICSDRKELCHRDLRNLSFFCQCFSAAFVCMSGFGLLLKREFTCKNHVFFMLSAAAGFSCSIISFIVPVEYATAALIGNFGPNLFLFYAVIKSGNIPAVGANDGRKCSIAFTAAKVLYLVGFVVYVLGTLLQVSGTVPCATDCPVNCPYDVPSINHNGAMYICFTLAYVLMATAYFLVTNTDAKHLATTCTAAGSGSDSKVVPIENEEEEAGGTVPVPGITTRVPVNAKASAFGSGGADVELGTLSPSASASGKDEDRDGDVKSFHMSQD